jgi:heme/copper-type cytochrome/quinol oxidase subunit 2
MLVTKEYGLVPSRSERICSGVNGTATRPAGGPAKRRRVRAAVGAVLAMAGEASAVSWWLPPNHSEHGAGMDSLFLLIFWITMAVMVGTFAVMIYFLVKYRYRPETKKAHYSQGNIKVEMAWTITPAIILAFISLYSKGVWDHYRHGKKDDTRKVARLLVVGQTFQWNVVYAGADGKLGRYLAYPKPTDKKWPKGADGKDFTFTFGKYEDTAGPADMPHDDAVAAINAYIDQENPLGKVFDPKEDPDGADDNWEKQPGRPIYVPKGRPVEVHLSSKDVLHSFFVPDLRVKLDAVPGLRGIVRFVATTTTKEIEDRPESRRTFANLDELAALIKTPEHEKLQIVIDEKSEPKAADAKAPGAWHDKRAGEWRYNGKDGKPIVNGRMQLNGQRIEALKGIGVKSITMVRPGFLDLVCAELCGQGHYTMQGQVIVLSDQEYAEQFETKPEAEEEADAGREKAAVARQ